MGAMIAFVLIVVCVMALMGFSSQFQASGTGRTYRRVIDMRAALEAGESALAEAVTAMRASMESGATTPECPDDWRAALYAAMATPGSAARGRKIVPKSAKDTFAAQGFTISDVRIDVIDAYMPPAPQSTAPDLPQGLVEMSVEVGGAQRAFLVKKVIRQRRSFYAVGPDSAAGDLDTARARLHLATHPLGTVIDQP